jgi:mannose-1-phosphate guanylyltransferase/mannose-6-phosphate isomerase
VVKHAVILAGGTGTRLWPASTRKYPKQFLRLTQGQSLFTLTLRRAIDLGIEGTICVVTHQDHARQIAGECEEVLLGASFPADRILVLAEPQGNNTAPAIAYACTVLRRLGSPEDTLIVMTADHTIEPVSAFLDDVAKAAVLAERDRLVTFGIPPEGPETGYGYVEAGVGLNPGFAVKKFKEKPDEATARSFLQQGNHYWNSGMFAFRIDRFLAELEKNGPEVARAFAAISRSDSLRPTTDKSSPGVLPVDETLKEVYRKSPSISIDYAVMEHSARCAVVPATFTWSDVGSWDVVAELFGPEIEAREAKGCITVDSGNNFVLSDLPVALVGVEDLIVVVKNGVVMVCRKGQSQQVKNVVQRLEKEERAELL